MAIRTFRCKDTEALFGGARVRRFGGIEAAAMRKLAMLHRAGSLSDLRVPPGNRLEALRAGREGQHSMINDQWRICFVWSDAVEIVDYL